MIYANLENKDKNLFVERICAITKRELHDAKLKISFLHEEAAAILNSVVHAVIKEQKYKLNHLFSVFRKHNINSLYKIKNIILYLTKQEKRDLLLLLQAIEIAKFKIMLVKKNSDFDGNEKIVSAHSELCEAYVTINLLIKINKIISSQKLYLLHDIVLTIF